MLQDSLHILQHLIVSV